MTSRPSYVGAMHRAHRAGHMSWLKRVLGAVIGGGTRQQSRQNVYKLLL
jgi:hypothetical protein